MPRPTRRPLPPPDARQASLLPTPRPGGRRTPEELAATVVAKRPSPVGQQDKPEVTLRLALRRKPLERLTARAIREERKLEALVQEILEDAAG